MKTLDIVEAVVRNGQLAFNSSLQTYAVDATKAIQSTDQMTAAMTRQAAELAYLKEVYPQVFTQIPPLITGAATEQKKWEDQFLGFGSKSLNILETLGQGLTKHSKLAKELKMAEAIIEAAWNAAKALEAYGDMNFWSAAQYAAAAVSFAAIAAGGGGGGGGTGGGGGVSSASAAQSAAAASAGRAASFGVPMAAGANTGPSTLHVVVMGESNQATYFASMLNNGVRSGGIQLQATHTAQGNAL